MTTLKKTGIAAAVTGAAMLFAGAAHADCSVSDSDKKGLFGMDKTYTTRFSGSSAKTVWDRYCKPFIQKNIEQHSIQNGKFSMHCSGSMTCDIQGDIVKGKPVVKKLQAGN